MSKRTRSASKEEYYRPSRFEFWKRLFIWIFIFVFAFSVAGGIIAFSVSR
ncbi:MAG TPA: hypothetical protein VFN49_04115 [Candidatus Aquilonibacter sp.]|nr:hypothetical protein [Candidatus Aquilonibacter sp.]